MTLIQRTNASRTALKAGAWGTSPSGSKSLSVLSWARAAKSTSGVSRREPSGAEALQEKILATWEQELTWLKQEPDRLEPGPTASVCARDLALVPPPNPKIGNLW
jgi:hypothetical protein